MSLTLKDIEELERLWKQTDETAYKHRPNGETFSNLDVLITPPIEYDLPERILYRACIIALHNTAPDLIRLARAGLKLRAGIGTMNSIVGIEEGRAETIDRLYRTQRDALTKSFDEEVGKV